MIAKINPNRTFAVLAEYTNDKKKDARIIAHQGVCTVSNQAIADSFEAQASSNRRVRKPCKHISLSFSSHDADKMTDDFMAYIAKEYMQWMGIRNTQYIVVRHNDKEHPHCHIVYNRVDNDGKAISDGNDYHRSRRIAYELTVKYGLYIASKEHDEEVKRNRLKGKDKTRYRMKDKVSSARTMSQNWHEFNNELHKRGLSLKLSYDRTKGLVRGVSFEEGTSHLAGAKLNATYQQLSSDFGDIIQDMGNDMSQEMSDALCSIAESTAQVISIGLDAVLELALPSQQPCVSSGYGGGTSNNRGWNDDDKKRKNENYKPFKFRR